MGSKEKRITTQTFSSGLVSVQGPFCTLWSINSKWVVSILYIHGSLKVKLLKFQSPVLGLRDHKLLDDIVQIIFKMQKGGKKK